jgi:hypothetical protein
VDKKTDKLKPLMLPFPPHPQLKIEGTALVLACGFNPDFALMGFYHFSG